MNPARVRRESARRKYRPTNSMKCLFIAESPPRDPDRFFYFEHNKKNDWLYLGLMKAIYQKELLTDKLSKSEITEHLRINKGIYLRKFCDDGFFLIDSYDESFETNKKSEKIIKISREKYPLSMKINNLKSSYKHDFPIILISRIVFNQLHDFLITNGLNVINHQFIPFPCCGWQKRFENEIIPFFNKLV